MDNKLSTNWEKDRLTRENLTNINNDIIKLYNNTSNLIKSTSIGNPIRIDDASPIPHEMNVLLKSKNIWCFDDMTYVQNTGAKITKTDTGFISYGGKGAYMYTRYRWLRISELDGLTITISCNVTPSGNNEPGLYIRYVSEDDTTKIVITDHSKIKGYFTCTFTIDSTLAPTCKYIDFTIYSNRGSEDNAASDDIVEWANFQIEEGTTAMPYSPFVDVNGAEIRRYGKNLCKDDAVRGKTYEGNGTGDPIQNQLSVRFPADNTPFTISIKFTAKDITATSSTSYLIFCSLYYADGTRESFWPVTMKNYQQGFGSFTVNKQATRLDIRRVANWTGGTITIDSIQVELGETATEHESFIMYTTHTADENGIVSGVTSLYPVTTLLAPSGTIVSAEYNKDINKIIEEITNAIISLGGTI